MRRIIVLLLSSALGAIGVPALASAASTPSGPGSKVAATPTGSHSHPGRSVYGNVDPTVGDFASLRTATSRTYPDPKHAGFRTVISGQPVNYRDTSGAWKPIDDTMVTDSAAGSGFRNAAGSYTVHLPASLASSVRFASGPYQVGLRLEGAAGSAHASGPSVTYAGALPATNVVYSATSAGLEERLVLSNPAAPATFMYTVTTTGGLNARISAHGGIDFLDGSGKVRLSSAPPLVADASGVTSASAVSYALSADGTTLTVSVDSAWLNAPGRAWPVVVDPGITNNAAQTCNLVQSAPTTSYCGPATLNVGYDGTHATRSITTFDLSSIPHVSNVYNADLSMVLDTASGSSTAVGAYQLSRAFTASATWNTYDGTHAWTTPGGDFTSLGYSTSSIGVAGTTYNWYPTQLVQGWVDGTIPNDGVIFKEPTENTVAQLAFWSSTVFTPTGDDPALNISWQPRVGLLPYYTQITQSLNDRMTLNINPATGNLELDAKDLVVPGAGGQSLAIDRYSSSLIQGSGYFAWEGTAGGGSWCTVGTDEYFTANYALSGQGGGSLETGDCAEVAFPTTSDTGSLISPPGLDVSYSLVNGADTLTYNQSGEVVTFDHTYNTHQIASDANRSGQANLYDRSTGGYPPSPVKITDSEGRLFPWTWDISNDNVTQIQDSSGNRSYTYNYGSGGYPFNSYTDPNSGTTQYFYQSGAPYDLNEIIDPVGNITTMNYDSTGRLTSLTRVTDTVHLTGPTWTFTYNADASDAAGNTVVTDPNGHTTTYYYDTESRVTSVKDGNGNTPQTLTYNTQNKPLTSYDQVQGQNNPTNYSYASNNLTKNITAPYQFSGDTRAQQIALYDLTSGSGIAGYQYLPTSVISPPSNVTDTNGECTAYTYDPAGNVTEVSPGHGLTGSTTNCDGATSPILYQYGRQGDTLNGSSVSCTGAKAGEVCYTKDANGNQTNYAYDANGNLTSVTPPTPAGPTTYTVDADSRVTSVTDGLGNTGTPATIASVQTGVANWSSGGVSTVTVTMPANVTVGDAVVLQVSTKAANPVVTVSSVTGGGLSWTKGPTKSSTTAGDVEIWYGTGSAGGSASITATLAAGTDQAAAFAQEFTGVASASALDTSGSATGNNNHMASPSLTTTKAGDVVWMTGYGASKITAWPASPWQSLNGPKYTDGNYYDSVAWQVAATTGAYSTTWTLAANANWNTVGIALKAGSRLTAYTYDKLDRVTQVLYGGAKACVPSTGDCIAYSYDGDGNLKTQVDQSGTTTYAYDALNRVIEKDVSSSPANACSGYSGMRYSYDGVGNLLTYCDSGGTVTYTYDAANNLKSLAEPGGNCTSQPVVQPCTTFNYDSDERLATTGTAPNQTPAETLPSGTGTVVNIGYDGAGNPDVIGYEKGLSGCATMNSSTCFVNNGYFFYLTVGSTQVDTGLLQAVSDNNATATIFRDYYDARDQLIQSQETSGGSANYLYAYDNNGNRCALAANCSSPTYTYNADNELTHGPAGSYTYDADGNDVTSPTLTNLTYNPKVQTTSITPSGKSAEAIGYAGGGQASRISLGTTTFADGLSGQPMEQVNGSTTIYFTRLPSGQLLSMRTGGKNYYYLTNSLGTILGLLDNTGSRTNGATYSYDPYGQQLTSSGSEASVNPYGFAGGYYDSNSKLVHLGQRDYDPATGRWTQRDPTGGGYTYAGNDPTSASDPSGEAAIPLAVLIFFTSINAVHDYLDYLSAVLHGDQVAAAVASSDLKDQLERQQTLEEAEGFVEEYAGESEGAQLASEVSANLDIGVGYSSASETAAQINEDAQIERNFLIAQAQAECGCP